MLDGKITELYTMLEKRGRFVLSSSFEDKVTSRMMSTIFYDNKIYFQTDKDFEKTKQIIANPNVALCIDNIQIEGYAKIIGPTLEQGKIMELYKTKHLRSFNSYSHLENTIMMEVTLHKVVLWKYIEEHSFRCIYDFENKVYTEEKYV